MKNILVINGNPTEDSYSSALANSYVEGAKSEKHHVETINIRDMDFNPNLMYGYKQKMPVEPDIDRGINKIQTADHLVWVFPMWWYGMPALMKGFIDRTFLPGIAFKSQNGKLPMKLLKGKSARIIVTSDTPRWYDYLFMKSPATNQLKKGVLEFTGIKPVRVTYISPIKNRKRNELKDWLDKVRLLGEKGK